jgi:hypothetical protein
MLNKSLVAEPSMLALNILTFCMDAVAVLLALTFTHNWGLRAPAWPTLFPMWAGTGFLAPIAVAWPIIILARMLGPGSDHHPAPAPAMLEPWVTKMVYTSFVCQGLALMTAFILYVRARWGTFMQAQPVEVQPPRPIITQLGAFASVVAVAAGTLHLLWTQPERLSASHRSCCGAETRTSTCSTLLSAWRRSARLWESSCW